jgi:hypothetical protein
MPRCQNLKVKKGKRGYKYMKVRECMVREIITGKEVKVGLKRDLVFIGVSETLRGIFYYNSWDL